MKIIIYVALLSIGLMACSTENSEQKNENGSDVTGIASGQTSSTIEAYITLKDALVNTDPSWSQSAMSSSTLATMRCCSACPGNEIGICASVPCDNAGTDVPAWYSAKSMFDKTKYNQSVVTPSFGVIPRQLLSIAVRRVKILRLFVAIAPPIFGKITVPGT